MTESEVTPVLYLSHNSCERSESVQENRAQKIRSPEKLLKNQIYKI